MVVQSLTQMRGQTGGRRECSDGFIRPSVTRKERSLAAEAGEMFRRGAQLSGVSRGTARRKPPYFELFSVISFFGIT